MTHADQIGLGPFPGKPDRHLLRFIAGAAVLVIAIFVAYLPALHGGPVWDDDYMLTANTVMADPHGLWRIWFDLSAVLVYYPLTLSAMWFEHKMFGLHDLTGYHVVNVLLHSTNAVILWRLLRRLNVGGAFAIAAIWGLHPVGVESVAWITEQKNTLSGLFYLGSLWALLRYYGVIGDKNFHRGGWYLIALLTFVLALAAKTTAVTLPAAALLLVWWKTGRIRKGNIWAIVPFVLLAAAAGSLTQYVEVHTTGSWREEWSLSFPQKVLVAGRSFCFYAGKLAWPANLSFAYPRWQIDPAVWWQWLYPIAVLGTVITLWTQRRRLGRGPLVGILFFVGTLFPASGFFHVLYQRYSFVADHFQYLAGVGLIAVVIGTVARSALPGNGKVVAFIIVAVTLGLLTARSSGRFVTDETVWASALALDPSNPMANLNYATDLIDRQRFSEAMPHLIKAAQSKSTIEMVWVNFGKIAEAKRDYIEAMDCYRRAIALEPDDPGPHFGYGSTLLLFGRFADAAEQLQIAVALRPTMAVAHDNLGVCLLRLGERNNAEREFRIAGQLNPDLPLIQRHLAEVAR